MSREQGLKNVKLQANNAFKGKDYVEALKLYSRVIDKVDGFETPKASEVAVQTACLANRANTNLVLLAEAKTVDAPGGGTVKEGAEWLLNVFSDTTRVLECSGVKPALRIKCFHRRAIAHKKKGELKKALLDILSASKIAKGRASMFAPPILKEFEELKNLLEVPTMALFEEQRYIGPTPYRDWCFPAWVVYNEEVWTFSGVSMLDVCESPSPTISNYVHAYNISKNTWREVKTEGTPPSGRYSHSMVLYKNALYVYGGYQNLGQHVNQSPKQVNRLCLKSLRWSIIMGKKKKWVEKRSQHCAWVVGSKMYIYGASAGPALEAFDLDKHIWSVPNVVGDTLKNLRNSAVTMYDDRTAYLFGGSLDDQSLYGSYKNTLVSLSCSGNTVIVKELPQHGDVPPTTSESTLIKVVLKDGSPAVLKIGGFKKIYSNETHLFVHGFWKKLDYINDRIGLRTGAKYWGCSIGSDIYVGGGYGFAGNSPVMMPMPFPEIKKVTLRMCEHGLEYDGEPITWEWRHETNGNTVVPFSSALWKGTLDRCNIRPNQEFSTTYNDTFHWPDYIPTTEQSGVLRYTCNVEIKYPRHVNESEMLHTQIAEAHTESWKWVERHSKSKKGLAFHGEYTMLAIKLDNELPERSRERQKKMISALKSSTISRSKSRVYELRVRILHITPSIWRTVKVSGNIRLSQLHDQILCPLIGWSRNFHGYMFRPLRDMWFSGPLESTSADWQRVNMCPFDLEDKTGLDSSEVRLKWVMQRAGDQLLYTYDLGEQWQHEIELKEITDEDYSSELVLSSIDGWGLGPPEDNGGPYFYVQRLNRFRNCEVVARDILIKEWKEMAAAKNISEQLGQNATYNPAFFDVESTRKRMLKILYSASSENEAQNFDDKEVEKLSGGIDQPNVIYNRPEPEIKKKCGNCSITVGLKTCSRCSAAWYCSQSCIVKDWPNHKKLCKKIAKKKKKKKDKKSKK